MNQALAFKASVGEFPSQLILILILILCVLSTILKGLGLEGKLTADQIAKKWDNLRTKYKVTCDAVRLRLRQCLSEAAAGPPCGSDLQRPECSGVIRAHQTPS